MPKKDKKLLTVLSQEEVLRILASVDNIKYKLMLLCSAGLRVGEIIKLRVEDVELGREERLVIRYFLELH